MTNRETPTTVRQLKALLLTTAMSTALLVPSVTYAQEAEADDLEEIVVTGIRGSLDSAAAIKRYADSIVDAISAEDIGLFSDNNIAEALQRIPGIQLERVEGEGSRVSIRGLGPRFVRTTLNGRTALSSPGGENGSDSRGFSFNIIPSEIISGAKVSKSTQAKDVEGGIGGVVDLQTVRPLDFANKKDQDLYVSGAYRGTYNDFSEKFDNRGSIYLNKKVSDKFAVFFATTYEYTDRLQHSTESQDLSVEKFDLSAGTILNGAALTEKTRFNAAVFDGSRNKQNTRERNRQTFTSGAQWQPNENLSIYLDWTHGREQENRKEVRSWLRIEDAVDRQAKDAVTNMVIDFADANEDSDGTILAFDFVGFKGRKGLDIASSDKDTDSKINVGGLNVEWTNDVWTVTADVGYAKHKLESITKRVTFEGNDNKGERFKNGFNGSFDIRSGAPIVLLTDTNGVAFDPASSADLVFDQDRHTFTLEDSEEVSFRLDFEREMEVGIFNRLDFGVNYRDRNLTRTEIRTDGNRKDKVDGKRPFENISLDSIGSSVVTNFLDDIDDPGFAHSFVVPDLQAWIAADPLGTFAGDPRNGLPRQDKAYDVGEEIVAVYAQTSFANDDHSVSYRGNIGVRVVQTTQTSVGILGEQNGADLVIIDPNFMTERRYTDILPSANIAFNTSENSVLRFAVSRALTRPDPVDLRIGFDLDVEDLDGDSGNPDLDAYRTWNFDASLEIYPEAGGSYALGLFYKKLGGWIADGAEIFDIDLGPGGIEEFEIDRPINTEGGTIKGVEFAFHTPLELVSESLSGFGVNGSITYVDAKIDSFRPGTQFFNSLLGTSKWSGNIVGYYENGPFSARVAYNLRSNFLNREAVSTTKFDEFTDGIQILDVNVSYEFNENLRVRLTANNLTDVQRTRFFKRAELVSDIRNDGRTFVIELRAKM